MQILISTRWYYLAPGNSHLNDQSWLFFQKWWTEKSDGRDNLHPQDEVHHRLQYSEPDHLPAGAQEEHDGGAGGGGAVVQGWLLQLHTLSSYTRIQGVWTGQYITPDHFHFLMMNAAFSCAKIGTRSKILILSKFLKISISSLYLNIKICLFDAGRGDGGCQGYKNYFM